MLLYLRCWSLALAACLFLSIDTAEGVTERFRQLTHTKGFGRKLLQSRTEAASQSHSARSSYRFLNSKTQREFRRR